ncbi:RIP metalloprotease RseP [Methylomagnum ishizawai]|uniref:RIP metalloprotease RseP n=1 Tax=Methylomagnum ishizawai TaxID=1760988 RepID=UPI001C32403C|nr:RIP metalloprotease RseP [Methylomagnum ishizawai]BBL76725.1 putative zinc metalloprotease [Methylomagnum ishizawai]
MFSLLHTLFFFVVALAVLIAFHEFGHFWAARRLGVKVTRFSLGFGKPLWAYQKSPDDTEFVVCALPLGGYVKMIDEREGAVAPEDLPFAFNRQPLWKRAGIVVAGPVFNLLLAVLIYWGVFMLGETGLRPVLGPVAAETLAGQAGFREGDEIVAVKGDPTPTWNVALAAVVETAVEEEPIQVEVKGADGAARVLVLRIPQEVAQEPEQLYQKLGFRPHEPALPPVIDRVEPGSAAEAGQLKPGDLIVSADGTAIKTWKEWVEFVRTHPDVAIRTVVERGGVRLDLGIKPKGVDSPEGRVGRIGAAVRMPEDMEQSLRAEYRLGLFPALGAAIDKTYGYAALTLKMIGRMVVGKAKVDNLSGPISIAQYAGQSASVGFGQFLKFLAIVSISLGVLNLLPIPVLDGGHLLFYLIEGVKGSPVSDRTLAYCQQVGMFILLCLMVLAFFLDIERLFN